MRLLLPNKKTANNTNQSTLPPPPPKLSYQRREGILWVNGVSCKVKEDLRDLSIIVDREILEVAANEDTLLYFFETDLQELAGKISVEADQKVDSCLWKIQ